MRDHPPIYELPAAPEVFARCPAAMQANWAEAKRAQGHPISEDRLARLTPAYLTGRPCRTASTTSTMTVEEQIRPHMARSLDRVRFLAANLAHTAGPDGDSAA